MNYLSQFISLNAVFLLFFSATFVGDFLVLGITPLIFFWLGLVVLRRGISTSEFVLSLFFLFLSFICFLRLSPFVQDIAYFNFVLQSFCYIIFVIYCVDQLRKGNSKIVKFLCFSTLLIFSLSVLYYSIAIGDRGRFIFGPNVIYRVLAFIYGIYLVRACKENFTLTSMLMFVLFAIGVVSTGSRGGMVVLVLYFFATLITFRRDSKVYGAGAALILIVAALLFVYREEVIIHLGRSIYFNLENNSEAYRFDKYTSVVDFYEYRSPWIGEGPETSYLSYYPHNIFLELYYYFGLLGLLLMLPFMCLSVIFIKRLWDYYLIFMGVFFGSLVSGNLQYNFVMLVFWFVSPYLIFRERKI